MHGLVQCAQEVLIELLFGVLVELVVLLEESLLGTDLCEDAVLIVAGRSNAPALIAATMSWSHCLDLLNNSRSWVDLVDHGEEAS